MKLSKLQKNFRVVLTQHNSFSEPIEVVKDNLYWAERILLNSDDRLAVRMSGKESFVARNRNTSHYRGNAGNLVYTSESL